MQPDILKHIYKGKIYALGSIPKTFLTQKELSYVVVSRII